MKVLALSTPLGLVFVGVSRGQVLRVSLGKTLEGPPADPEDPEISPIYRAFAAYLRLPGPLNLPAREGWQQILRLEVDLSRVPPGYRRVLETLRREVPFGHLVTYGALARRVDTHPRVVGQALARNPVPIVIPCHRVVARRGPGGFSPGLAWKYYLWRLEGIKGSAAKDPAARG